MIELPKPTTPPQHSERFTNRMAANKTMPESHHINHFIQRLKERFSIEISIDEYYQILEKVKMIKALYKLNSNTYVIPVTIHDKEVWVVYGKTSSKNPRFDRVPRRLKTALVPHEMYLVPDCLYKVYDHKTFSEQVKWVVDVIKNIADNLDLSDKAAFFRDKSIDERLKKGAVSYKEKKGVGEHILVNGAVRYIVEKTLENEKIRLHGMS